MHAPVIELERVRRHTAPQVNAKIDEVIAETVRHYAAEPESVITDRINQIDQEWDIERTLETNASVLGLTGVVLGATVDKRWLALSGAVLGLLFMHATQGWCPPIPVLRRMGVRTRSEMDRERFALKFLRGDFDELCGNDGRLAPDQVVDAVSR